MANPETAGAGVAAPSVTPAAAARTAVPGPPGAVAEGEGLPPRWGIMRAPGDRPVVPRVEPVGTVLGAERLRDRLRGAAGAGRAAGRSLRAAPVPAGRGGRVHPRLGRPRGGAHPGD